MKKKAKKIVILSIGIIFIIIGLIGLVLPFLQGILFLIIGGILISLCSPKVHLLIKKHTDRHSHLSPMINKIENWLVRFIGDM